MIFRYADFISGVKNSSIIRKGQNTKMATNLTKKLTTGKKIHARFFIKWYAILNSALISLKQKVLIMIYVFITN